MKNYLMPQLIVAAMIFFLSGCTLYETYQANKYLKEGDYKASVHTVTARFDELGELPSGYSTRQMTDIVNKAISHYEGELNKQRALVRNYNKKIAAYKEVLWLRTKLDNKFYSPLFSDFNTKYTIAGLNTAIAEQHYFAGNEIVPLTANDFYARYKWYSDGSHYANYMDMKTLAQSDHKQYATLTAEEKYNAALVEARTGKLSTTVNLLKEVVEIYKPYGTYKDSDKLLTQYDKTWRLNLSTNAYNEATQLAAQARSKSDHRKVSERFMSAHDYYAGYGKFKDAKELGEKHKNLGIVAIALVFKGSEGGLNNNVSLAAQSIFSKPYYHVNYSGGRKDITITLDYDRYYDASSDKTEYKKLIKTFEDGTSKNFTEVTDRKRNECEINATFTVSGQITYHDTFRSKKKSSEQKVSYIGDVPDGYKNHTDGNYESEPNLCWKVRGEIEDIVRDKLKVVHESAEQL